MTRPKGDYVSKISMHKINKQINSCIKYISEIDEERAEHVRSLNAFVKERDIRQQNHKLYQRDK